MREALQHDAVQSLPVLSGVERARLLTLARRTLEAHTRGRAPPAVPLDSPGLIAPRGCFVTLTERGPEKRLRGCCGEYVPRRALAEAVARMTVVSATEDPRFPPVTGAEAGGLRIEISALTALQPIRPEQVEVGRHGLLLRTPRAAGLLLPQVPVGWGWDVPTFLQQLCVKAGVPDGAYARPDAEMLGFEADVWGEEEWRDG
ncbi:MAG TPA: AmmeMemoRadiSam system protein A [Gemmatimonadaceae bacterium]